MSMENNEGHHPPFHSLNKWEHKVIFGHFWKLMNLFLTALASPLKPRIPGASTKCSTVPGPCSLTRP